MNLEWYRPMHNTLVRMINKHSKNLVVPQSPCDANQSEHSLFRPSCLPSSIQADRDGILSLQQSLGQGKLRAKEGMQVLLESFLSRPVVVMLTCPGKIW